MSGLPGISSGMGPSMAARSTGVVFSTVMTFARRAATVGATLATVTAGSLLLAQGAYADDPSGWSNAPHVAPIKWLLVLLIIPLGAAIVISIACLLPGILRGEGLVPKPFPKSVEDEAPSHH